MTVKDIRDAIASLPDDAPVLLSMYESATDCFDVELIGIYPARTEPALFVSVSIISPEEEDDDADGE